jgi:hypothetical protein
VDYCFDTSGINRLHDDPGRQGIVAGLLKQNRVLLAALNVIEAATTADARRRESLLALLRELFQDRPLSIPVEILRRLTKAYSERRPSAEISVGENDNQIWWVLHEPEKLDEEARQEALDWKEKLEGAFSDSHRQARLEMRKLFAPKPPKSLGQFLQFYCNNSGTFLSSASRLHEELTGKPLDEDAMRDLFRNVPEWPLYMAGWAQGMYARALQDQNYGAKSNPGTIDLWFAVHLAHCDFLVTNDRGQYRALRVLNVLGERRRERAEVLTYEQFKRRMCETTSRKM